MLRELGARWLVEAVEYISENPSIIVYGFSRSGIFGALDNSRESEDEEDIEECIDTCDEFEDEDDDDMLMSDEESL